MTYVGSRITIIPWSFESYLSPLSRRLPIFLHEEEPRRSRSLTDPRPDNKDIESDTNAGLRNTYIKMVYTEECRDRVDRSRSSLDLS